tara:strand:+ start:111 stop:593 length:483 start_codon:yes stop_codon:yes gene_type:complete
MRYWSKLLTIIVFFFCTTIAVAEENKVPNLENEKIKLLAEVSACEIAYYNLTVFFLVTNIMNDEFQIEHDGRQLHSVIFEKSKTRYKDLTAMKNSIANSLVEEGYDTYTIQMIMGKSQQEVIGLVQGMISGLIQDPSKASTMFGIFVNSTDQCDGLLKSN